MRIILFLLAIFMLVVRFECRDRASKDPAELGNPTCDPSEVP